MVVGDPARFDRQMVDRDAERRGGRADLGEVGLVGAFAFRTVADDRADAGGVQRGQVGHGNLRRHGERVGQRAKSHVGVLV